MDANNRPNRCHDNGNASINKKYNKTAAAAAPTSAHTPIPATTSSIDVSANYGSASTNACSTESGEASSEPPKSSVAHSSNIHIERNGDAGEETVAHPRAPQKFVSKPNENNTNENHHKYNGTSNASSESSNSVTLPVSESLLAAPSSSSSLSTIATMPYVVNDVTDTSTNKFNVKRASKAECSASSAKESNRDVFAKQATPKTNIMINRLADNMNELVDSNSQLATATTGAPSAQTPDSDIVSKSVNDKNNIRSDDTIGSVALKPYEIVDSFVYQNSIDEAEQRRSNSENGRPSNFFNSKRNSTETCGSDIIDVKPSCLDSADREEGSKSTNELDGVVSENSSNSKVTQPSTAVNMDDDRSQRVPLLGNGRIGSFGSGRGNNSSIDYNSIDKSIDVSGRGRHNSDKNIPETDDAYSKRVLYNDYVNLLCDANVGRQGVTEQWQRNVNIPNGRNVNNFGRHDENRPLLRHQQSLPIASMMSSVPQKSSQKLRGIVKSPSNENFGTNGEKFAFETNRKPRLSIQCTGSDPDRPVLHVQFLAEQNRTGHDDNNLAKSYPQTSIPHESDANAPANSFDRTLSNHMRHSSISSTTSSSMSSSDSESSSDEGSSIGQFAEAKPPDGGWGWVVVFASFMVNLIADGITFSFGVIYAELLKYFGESKAKTAWIGSLFMAMPLLSGPIASFLTDRYGCRKVTIVGSILASIGFIISSFTDSVEMLFFTFGIFAGFGLR